MSPGRAAAARSASQPGCGVSPVAAVRFIQADDPALESPPRSGAHCDRRRRSAKDRQAADADADAGPAGGPFVSIADDPIEYATPKDLRDPAGTGSPLLRVRDLRTHFPI